MAPLVLDISVISVKAIHIPSFRISAGIYLSINGNLTNTQDLLSNRTVVWDETLTVKLSDSRLPICVQLYTRFESHDILGDGELMGELETSLEDLIAHGIDVIFDMSFPTIRMTSPMTQRTIPAVHPIKPVLTLKVDAIQTVPKHDSMDIDSNIISECKLYKAIVKETAIGHAQFAQFMTRGGVAHLKIALSHFKRAKDKCPVGHGARAAAVTNLAWARLAGFIYKYPRDLDTIIPLFREALTLRSRGTPDHALSVFHLALALNRLTGSEQIGPGIDIRECAKLYYDLRTLCHDEGTGFYSCVVYGNDLTEVIRKCNSLETGKTDEDLQFRRMVAVLCRPEHPCCPKSFEMLARLLFERGSKEEIDESIVVRRLVVNFKYSATTLHNLMVSLRRRHENEKRSEDLDEIITLCKDALMVCPVEHVLFMVLVNNFGRYLMIRFILNQNTCDIDNAINIFRATVLLDADSNDVDGGETETPTRIIKLRNLSLALTMRYVHGGHMGDRMEAIVLCRESLGMERPEESAAGHLNAAVAYVSDACRKIRMYQNLTVTDSSSHLE